MSPLRVKAVPRREIDTSSADSIWRRFASSAPHRRARRGLSIGSNRISGGLSAGLRWAALLRIDEFAAQSMGERARDAHIGELAGKPGPACEIHGAVVRAPSD